jgi:hypothetical protein
MGTIRHKNVLLCPLSAVAFSFLHRWGYRVVGGSAADKSPERHLPSHRHPEEFYNKYAFPGDILKPEKQWPYQSQLTWQDKMFKASGIHAAKTTHAGRRQAARHAELAGVAESQIRRAGHWNLDVMTNAYIDGLPLEFIRSMAGFRKEGGSFFLPRARITPPDALQRQIWPEVDHWIAKYAAYNSKAKDNGVERSDKAGMGHLLLLKHLRVVILQDSVVLRPMFPNHPIWKSVVFSTPEYNAFKQQALIGLENPEDPADLQIKQAMPLLAEQISLLREEIKGAMAVENQKTRDLIAEFAGTVTEVIQGKRSMTLTLNFSPKKVQGAAGEGTHLGVDLQVNAQPDEPSEVPSAASDPQEESDAPSTVPARTLFSQQHRPERFNPQLPPIFYGFNRGITTVLELQREWYHGLYGGPSIVQLNATWGARWKTPKEGQFYSRRLPIIEAIEGLVAKGRASSTQEAAATIETLRLQGNISLNKLAVNCRDGSKEGATIGMGRR